MPALSRATCAEPRATACAEPQATACAESWRNHATAHGNPSPCAVCCVRGVRVRGLSGGCVGRVGHVGHVGHVGRVASPCLHLPNADVHTDTYIKGMDCMVDGTRTVCENARRCDGRWLRGDRGMAVEAAARWPRGCVRGARVGVRRERRAAGSCIGETALGETTESGYEKTEAMFIASVALVAGHGFEPWTSGL